MNSVRSLAIGFLFTLLVLGESFPLTQQDSENIKVINGEYATSIDQDGVSTLTAPKSVKFGGRKMVINIGLGKDQTVSSGGQNKETTTISGKDAIAGSNLFPGESQRMTNSQVNGRPSKLEISAADEAFQKSEAKRILEDTAEIVSLMHKDYSAFHMGRRKPPIHNDQPLKEENETP